MREAPLTLQVVEDRLALLAALGDLAGRTGQVQAALEDLVERPDAALHGQVLELLAVLRVVVPDPDAAEVVRVALHRLRRKLEDDPARPRLLPQCPAWASC